MCSALIATCREEENVINRGWSFCTGNCEEREAGVFHSFSMLPPISCMTGNSVSEHGKDFPASPFSMPPSWVRERSICVGLNEWSGALPSPKQDRSQVFPLSNKNNWLFFSPLLLIVLPDLKNLSHSFIWCSQPWDRQYSYYSTLILSLVS